MNFFEALRAANIKRLPQFKNRRGEPAHSQPDGSDWSNLTWINAVLGELGETSNVIKKILRGDYETEVAGQIELGKEIADVMTYLDITAFRLGLGPLKAEARDEEKLKPGSEESMTYHAVSIMVILSVIAATQFGNPLPMSEEEMREAFNEAAWHLSRLAQLAGSDLEAVTIAKFNAVSRRVDSSVFLDAGEGYCVFDHSDIPNDPA